MSTEHKTTYLKDYTPYPFFLNSVDLNFQIFDGETFITSSLALEPRSNNEEPLYLYGEDLEIISVQINGDEAEYSVDDSGMTISSVPDGEFILQIKTKIIPEDNTRLEGLYMSGGNYCTQCEAEGFRRITYFPDRPDVMSIYTTRIEADKAKFPVLLGNGNLQESGDLDGGRHFAVWHDPHRKPCYLFALVAGNLVHLHDTFTTAQGRKVDLYIYVRDGDLDQCDHAMDSLKRSMKWDEDVYGLSYDLDIFNIVAVSDFNMGAMENKSLNIFNTALVLARPDTATDQDYMRVESVIAHEYFHNWSGNRVTCRDWFQLSLKEGLTVFRDQEFSADTHSAAVQRIDDVTHLRRLQFAEDASPLAHPIRPESYIEINNFYTMTVYEKGAEVIRMFRTLMGKENYRKATDLYFSRHDGQAATCEDWIACMSEASGLDLGHFSRWYHQSGTPRVSFTGVYDRAFKTYTIQMEQHIPDAVDGSPQKPMHIPIALGLLDHNGQDLIETRILHLIDKKQEFVIDIEERLPKPPVPSILRGYSAPIILESDLSLDDCLFLMEHDSDGFNRWEAGQSFLRHALHHHIDMLEDGEDPDFDTHAITSLHHLIQEAKVANADHALLARMLSVPSVSEIMGQRKLAQPDLIEKAIHKLEVAIKRLYKEDLLEIYHLYQVKSDLQFKAEDMGRRALCHAALRLLTSSKGGGCAHLATEHYKNAKGMTERIAALSALSGHPDAKAREQVFSDFYDQFKAYPLVIDKWFALQACGVRDDVILDLKLLAKHSDFNVKNPNRVRSLYAAFAMNNPSIFHANDGSGYEFVCDAICQLNAINPQIAARLLTPFRGWTGFSVDRQEKMKACLQRILDLPDLSPDIYEIASKSLHG